MRKPRKRLPPRNDAEKIACLLSLYARQLPEECQVWPGSQRRGYARLWLNGRSQSAHRVMWELVRGPLGEMTLDHYRMNSDSASCSKACINVYHLEPVPGAVNILRGSCPAAQNRRKTHCKRGHEFTAVNTMWEGARRRICRICHRESSRNGMRRWRKRRSRGLFIRKNF